MSQVLPRLWIITDPEHPDGPVDPLRRALEGCPPGAVGVQLRAPHVGDRQLLTWARELRELTSEAGAAFLVNRRLDVAEIVAADGVHLPERGLPLSEIRREFTSFSILGVSRHDRGGLESAEQIGASFAFLSPVFQVPNKARPIGVHGFGTAIAGVGIPTYALGGVQPEDLQALLGLGAYGVAIRRAIYEAAQPRDALQQFLDGLDKSFANGE